MVTIGVSLKMYFSHRQATQWFTEVAARLSIHPAIATGTVRFFVAPTYLQILLAVEAFSGTGMLIGAQDVAADSTGPYTGEVSAAELAEIGASIAEIGHAERRRLFGEDDDLIARKTAAAVRHGITPLICVGETERMPATQAAAAVLAQLRASLAGVPAGPVIVAYEPVWAIGAAKPAETSHVVTVTSTLRAALDSWQHRSDSAVIYGGSAGPGLLTELGDAVDGLFLGRFAHDPDALVAVLDEAVGLATARIA